MLAFTEKSKMKKLSFLRWSTSFPEPKKQAHDWRILGQAEEEKYQEVLSGTWLGKTLFDENGIANYKLADGKAVERTEKEKQEELAARPAPLPSRDERLDALERAMLAMMMGGMPSV